MDYKPITQAYNTALRAEETGRILEKATILMFYDFITQAKTPAPRDIQEKISRLQEILESHSKEHGKTRRSKVQ